MQNEIINIQQQICNINTYQCNYSKNSWQCYQLFKINLFGHFEWMDERMKESLSWCFNLVTALTLTHTIKWTVPFLKTSVKSHNESNKTFYRVRCACAILKAEFSTWICQQLYALTLSVKLQFVNNNATSYATLLSAFLVFSPVFILRCCFFFSVLFVFCIERRLNANFQWISPKRKISFSLSMFLYLYSSVIICSEAIFLLFSPNSYMNAHILHRIGIQNENYNE